MIAGDLSGVQSCYVIYGGASLLSLIDISTLTTTQGFSLYGGGAGCSWAGDINNDGYSDMLVGNTGEDVSHLIYGSSSQSNTSPSDTTDIIIGASIGGAAVLGIAGYAFYAYGHNLWPFVGESLASKAVEVTGVTDAL